MSYWRWEGGRLLLAVHIQPRASRDEIVGPYGDDSLKIRLSAPPVDGKANAHLIKFFAKQFGVAKSQIELLSGHSGRDKRVAIQAPTRLPSALDANLVKTGGNSK